ncbi:heme exporter protein CcmD [Hoeflea sp. YIM 152468]|uniref:heme exporter protein CcmD n=1 Tax=Hoeflea sp. YIM 152468 TaxID=3031759 RepID=UPI0023D9DB71|nr:heme exporter protein CcmD [Hoeflea sp. YIM 152468]MDF1608186.1 heme exporter protein CcmD [Hoeflea sp. YIM 152468]
MMSHQAFVFLSYAASAVTLAGLLAAILLDGRARRRELSELEAQGVRRRSMPVDGSGS